AQTRLRPHPHGARGRLRPRTRLLSSPHEPHPCTHTALERVVLVPRPGPGSTAAGPGAFDQSQARVHHRGHGGDLYDRHVGGTAVRVRGAEIGRASCRVRVYMWVVVV